MVSHRFPGILLIRDPTPSPKPLSTLACEYPDGLPTTSTTVNDAISVYSNARGIARKHNFVELV
jgi:hypothetical protein